MNESVSPAEKQGETLGCLHLWLPYIGSASTTLYLKKDGELFAVLHTDTRGKTEKIWLPASRDGGTEYDVVLETGRTEKVTVYPFLTNIRYIDEKGEDV